jgi:hypothetical protein
MTRDQFMLRLAEAIRPRNPAAGAAVLAKHLPLMTDMPDELFSDEMLQVVAPRLSRTPTLHQLRKALEDARRQPEMLRAFATEDDRADLDDNDRAVIRGWNLRRSEGFREYARRPGSDGDPRSDDPHATPQRFLSMVRTYFPRAYHAITATDVVAADIAMRAGWVSEEQPDERTAEELAYVADRVAEALHVIAGAKSPQFTVNEQRDQLTPAATVKPQHLTPAQLDQINPLPGGRRRAL